MTTLHYKHPDIKGNAKTEITTGAAAAATSLTVTNTNQMISDEYVVIGGYGSSKAELILTGTISTDTALPLATALDFAHVAGEVVQHIYYNQIEISYSTNLETLWEGGAYASLYDAMSAATWSSLATVDIEVTQKETVYHDTTAGRSYRARYKNADETLYSDYFDIRLPDGYEEKSIAYIFNNALDITNKKSENKDGSQIYDSFLYNIANEGLRKVHQARKRWSHDQTFETVIGEITSGVAEYILPNNIETRDTKRSFWNLRVEDGYNLTYIDKREFDSLTTGRHTSPLAGTLTSASSTITLDDTSNFPDSGSFDVWTGTTHDTVEYSANNRTTNTLTLSSASTDVTTTHAVDTPVWRGASFGTPTQFTVYDGKIVFPTVPDDSLHQRTIDGDYYLKCQQINSHNDYVRIGDPNALINYVRWGIMIKAGNPGMAQQYMQMFNDCLIDMKRLETSGQRQYLAPRRSYVSYRQRVYNRNNFN